MQTCKDNSIAGIHKFEARYDEKIVTDEFTNTAAIFFQRDLPTNKTYVHDICVYCGKIVVRTKCQTV